MPFVKAYADKNQAQLLRWKEELQLDSLDQLLTSALKPTLIIPSNITFYPIRSSENLLLTGVELFADNLSLRQTEELLIEGNIMLKNTDMDIRMGTPIEPHKVSNWWNRYLLKRVTSKFKTLDDVFSLHTSPKNWQQKYLGAYFKKMRQCHARPIHARDLCECHYQFKPSCINTDHVLHGKRSAAN